MTYVGDEPGEPKRYGLPPPSAPPMSSPKSPPDGSQPPPVDKSAGVAFVLTFFFGPVGLLYVSVAGGLILTLVAIVGFVLTLGIGTIVAWVISIIWGCVEASRKHSTFQQYLASISSGTGHPAPSVVGKPTPPPLPHVPPPGWHPDPADPSYWRWWDGSRWTEATQPRFETPPPPASGV